MIHRTDKRRDKYAAVSQAMLRNTDLSLKAKGLLALMLSMADGWEFSIDGLTALSKDGIDTVKASLKELEKAHYITKKRTRDETGKFNGFVFEIYESPQVENPQVEKPQEVLPQVENPRQRITNNKNNQIKNNQYTGGAKKPKVINGGRTEPSYDISEFEQVALRPVLYRKKG